MPGPGSPCKWCTKPIPARRPNGRPVRKDAETCGQECRQAFWRFGARGPATRLEGPARRFAYADPPYPGMSERWYADHPDFAGEVDHRDLIERLVAEFPDGWALSTSNKTLAQVLALCPPGVRVGAWTFPTPPQSTRRARTAWEPVIFYGGRPRPAKAPTLRDWIYAPPKRWRKYPGGVVGMKPPEFSWWVFDCLGAQAGDELADLFPGSGAVTRAWERYVRMEPGEASRTAGGTRRIPDLPREAVGRIPATDQLVDGRQLDVYEVLGEPSSLEDAA